MPDDHVCAAHRTNGRLLELTLADVPPAEVHQATRLLADTLACGLAARDHELAEALTAYARRSGPSGST